jgi:DNA-binding LytR/AlgR family response regulator
MEILIIEDESPAAKRLTQLVSELLPQARIHGHLDSISAAVEWFRTNHPPDLIFCDIQLADGHSFEIFNQIHVTSPIIFTTAYDQYAIKAFKLNSVDYLLKPLDPKELAAAIRKYQQQHIQPSLPLDQLREMLLPKTTTFKSRFLVKFGEKIQSIQVAEIAFFFSEERVTFLQTKEGKRFILDFTMDQVQESLDPKGFFRLNRKYIASFDAIAEIHTYSNSRLKIKLHHCTDNDILVSREKVGELKEWLDG